MPRLEAMQDDEVVLVTDTFDALLVTPAQHVRDVFLSAYTCKNGNPCRIVIAAEMLCDTPSCRSDAAMRQRMMDMVPKTSRGSRYQFLNAGSLIGFASELRVLFNAVITQMTQPGFRGDDQYAMSTCYTRQNREKWTIDYDTKLIAVLSPDPAMFDDEWTFANAQGRDTSPLRRRLAPANQRGPGILHFAGVRYLDKKDQVHSYT